MGDKWGDDAYLDDLGYGPEGRVILDDTALGQQSDFDRLDALLVPQHALDGLWVVRSVSWTGSGGVERTSTQAPQVIPSMRSSHFSMEGCSLTSVSSRVSSGSSRREMGCIWAEGERGAVAAAQNEFMRPGMTAIETGERSESLRLEYLG